MDQKHIIHRYLKTQRDALLAKLDGLSERDVRWPMTANRHESAGPCEARSKRRTGLLRRGVRPALQRSAAHGLTTALRSMLTCGRPRTSHARRSSRCTSRPQPRQMRPSSAHSGLARPGSVVASGAGAGHPSPDHGAHECGDGSARRATPTSSVSSSTGRPATRTETSRTSRPRSGLPIGKRLEETALEAERRTRARFDHQGGRGAERCYRCETAAATT